MWHQVTCSNLNTVELSPVKNGSYYRELRESNVSWGLCIPFPLQVLFLGGLTHLATSGLLSWWVFISLSAVLAQWVSTGTNLRHEWNLTGLSASLISVAFKFLISSTHRSLFSSFNQIDSIENIHFWHIIHCNLKPDNILIGLGKSGNIIHLVDFGLAR